MTELNRKWKHVLSITCILALFVMVNLNASNLNDHNGVQFYEGNLDDIKRFAGQNGKLVFVEFYADWCAPCKWMEETTFTEANLSSFLNEHFISAKINVDDFDGYAAKEEYGVLSLPTMLVFNSQGKLLNRIEESMGAIKLLTILEDFNIDENKVLRRQGVNISPRDLEKSKTYVREINKPTRKYQEENNHKNYQLEVGTYHDYESVLHRYHELKKIFLEPIIVLNDYKYGSIRYHVLMGDFKTKSEAISFSKILDQQFNIKSKLN